MVLVQLLLLLIQCIGYIFLNFISSVFYFTFTIGAMAMTEKFSACMIFGLVSGIVEMVLYMLFLKENAISTLVLSIAIGIQTFMVAGFSQPGFDFIKNEAGKWQLQADKNALLISIGIAAVVALVLNLWSWFLRKNVMWKRIK